MYSRDLHDKFTAHKIPKHCKLLKITETEHLRILPGEIQTSSSAEANHDINSLTFSDFGIRGKILEIFSKIEFIVNELIKFDILGVPDKNTDWKKRSEFDEILNFMDLYDKVRILDKHDYFSHDIRNKLLTLKNVRNGFAHSWAFKEIHFKGLPIEHSFEEFKNELLEAWKILLDVYKEEQDKIDIDNLF